MKRYQKQILTAGIIAVVTVGGAFTYIANAELPGGSRRPGMFLAKLAELGITEAQKASIKSILEKHQPTARPLVKEFVTERRALRDLTHAETVDEKAIRDQVEKMAKIGADLAVEKAKVTQEIRQVLTAPQIEKLKEMRSEIDDRVDEFLSRAGQRYAE